MRRPVRRGPRPGNVIDASMGMFRATPWVGLIPLFIVWFGIHETPEIALVALGVTYPLPFAIYGGIRSADAQLIGGADGGPRLDRSCAVRDPAVRTARSAGGAAVRLRRRPVRRG